VSTPETPELPRSARRHARVLRLADRVIHVYGLPRHPWQDLYHRAMTASWPGLFAALAALYLCLNLAFACLYALEPGCIANLNPAGFAGNFFFSVETLATVGYGDMHPQTLYGHLVATGEIFVGTLGIALMTGAMFARFSRPRARVLFSRRAVIRPMDGRPTLVLRAANARQNVIVEASAQLRLMQDSLSPEGVSLRRLSDLALVRSQHPIFLLGWTLMHVIDEASPLHGLDAAQLIHRHASLILTLTGTDETTGQLLTARHEYRAADLHWNHAFRDVLLRDGEGREHLDYAHFHTVEPLAGELPRGS
jgi:inward rectifier potassium channel